MVLCRSWINVGIVCWVNTCGLFRLFCTGRKCTDLQWIVGAFQGIQVLPLGGCWFIQRQKTPHHSITIIMYTDASFKLYLQQSPFLTIFTYLLIINLKGNFQKNHCIPQPGWQTFNNLIGYNCFNPSGHSQISFYWQRKWGYNKMLICVHSKHFLLFDALLVL